MRLGGLIAVIHLIRAGADIQAKLVQLGLPSHARFRYLLLNGSFPEVFHRALEIVSLQRKAILRINGLQQIVLLLTVRFDPIVELRFFFFDFRIGPNVFAYGPIVLVFTVVSADFRRIFIGIGRLRVVIVSVCLIRFGSG